MSRGSEVVIGVILLLFAAVLFLLASLPDEQQYFAPRLMFAMLAGVLGFATLFTWGRPHTTRVAMGLLSIGLFAMAVYMLREDQSNTKGIVFAVITGLMSGTYAATGGYPRWLPMAEVFGAKKAR